MPVIMYKYCDNEMIKMQVYSELYSDIPILVLLSFRFLVELRTCLFLKFWQPLLLYCPLGKQGLISCDSSYCDPFIDQQDQ